MLLRQIALEGHLMASLRFLSSLVEHLLESVLLFRSSVRLRLFILIVSLHWHALSLRLGTIDHVASILIIGQRLRATVMAASG